MIDIHSHILHCVDDGSPSVEESIRMLKEAERSGVTDLILTPHLRGEFCLAKEKTLEVFGELKSRAEKEKILMNLYLGQEIFVNDDFFEKLKSGQAWTMADSNYLLLEFDYFKDTDICEMVYEAQRLGYKVIVAHPERYEHFTIETAFEIKDLGGLIQVNAESVAGKVKKSIKKLIKQMFKAGLIDFVASDVHSNRENLLLKAQKIVKTKFGEDAEKAVFSVNAKKIIKNSKG